MSLRDDIVEKIGPISAEDLSAAIEAMVDDGVMPEPEPEPEPEPARDQPAPEPDDEIVAAIARQLDTLETTLHLMALQIRNLRSEVELFSQPQQSASAPAPPAPPASSTVTRSSGAVVEVTLPPEKRLPDYCDHDDALIVDTAMGPVRVCPDCPDE